MHRTRFFSFFAVLVCLLLLTPAAQAASIKDRMKDRLPEINTLKDQGLVGENNRGFLEYRTGKKVKENLVASENSDRQTVYEAIGKSQGAPADLVGKRRAKMIAENGQAGHWYQKPDGSWYRK